ncbi:CaiB/BaiF CoA transferase family protein [Thermomonospora umbrina]|uniref:Succinyl-CoA:(R)-citramalate CoA-transferase n=1 Tax=Thermomonospora umbrina TaxID=111806 RepID=A0A3D9SR22_9ACTN|nr:CoA transferase [Thermomonospora umbrina]REE95084.1 succinyl-CoA:(R)-citramalate CoA-transferase [Thermomonospora umbrina]
MTGPLTGLRVLELGSLIAGPYAGRILADFGAEVIKIEDPRRPDPLRDWGAARHRGHALWWSVQSRNKKLITLDLRSGEGRDLLLRLAESSDVLLENFRPGTLERWGLAPETLWERNRGLVIARVSGFGQSGRNRHRPGYASVAEAIGGLRHLAGFPDRPPPRPGVSLGDSLAAMIAVQGIMMALYWRDTRSGTGQIVDVSLVEACFSLLEGIVPEHAATGAVRGPTGTALPGLAPSNLYRTADDRWVVIAANQDTVFARLADRMDRPDLTEDPHFATHTARGAHQAQIDAIVQDWVATLDADTALGLLDSAAVPAGLVYTVADIFADPLFTERRMLLPVQDPDLGEIVMPGVVPALTETPGAVRWPGPLAAGSHNAEVLGTLAGLDPDALQRLAERKVL